MPAPQVAPPVAVPPEKLTWAETAPSVPPVRVTVNAIVPPPSPPLYVADENWRVPGATATLITTSLPLPPAYVIVAVLVDPRKFGITAPSERPVKVPVTPSAPSLFTITKLCPPAGTNPPHAVSVSVALPRLTWPTTLSWSGFVGESPGAVPPISTAKVEPAAKLVLPALMMPGLAPGGKVPPLFTLSGLLTVPNMPSEPPL